MKTRKESHCIVSLTLLILLSACSNIRIPTEQPTETSLPTAIVTETTTNLVREVEIVEIPLPEPINNSGMEFSGLAWYQDKLILLPQYPNRHLKEGMGQLFYIDKASLLDYLSNPDRAPIDVIGIPFNDGGLSESIKGFEGYEAIVFNDQQVFVSIETRDGSPMMGYLVSGTVAEDLESINLKPESLIILPPQADYSNASDEAITLFNGKIVTFFEDNGKVQNPDPKAQVINSEMVKEKAIDFPNIEYRVTDATEVEPDGTFWVLNYFYPEDVHLLASSDPIADKYGKGPTHQIYSTVERILELNLSPDGIVLKDTPPIQFQLLQDGESRNWEGLVKMNDLGFFVVTDKFPETILGFCPFLR